MVRWKNKCDLYAMSAIHDSGVTKIDRKHGDQVRKPNIMLQYIQGKSRSMCSVLELLLDWLEISMMVETCFLSFS